MNTEFVYDICNRVFRLARKHTPEILAGVGIAGFATTTYLAVKATPEAEKLIEETKKELGEEELTTVETVKAAWKPYVPAALTGVSSALCVIGSVNVSMKRNAALATTYEMTRAFLNEYRSKVIETVGEKKEKKIQNAIVQDRIDKNPPEVNVNIISPDEDGTYKSLFFERITNQFFLATRDEVIHAINKGYETQNESFDESMNAYEWLTILNPKLIDMLPDGQVDMYMHQYWTRSRPYEGFTAEINDQPFTVQSGKWKGCACFAIEYGSYPTYEAYPGY